MPDLPRAPWGLTVVGMNRLSRFLSSSIGAKLVVAVTGLLLSLFAVGHLAGNFSIFAGPDAINSYAQMLQSMGAGLWLVRGGLLLIFISPRPGRW